MSFLIFGSRPLRKIVVNSVINSKLTSNFGNYSDTGWTVISILFFFLYLPIGSFRKKFKKE